jgi:hypothetical protein
VVGPEQQALLVELESQPHLPPFALKHYSNLSAFESVVLPYHQFQA